MSVAEMKDKAKEHLEKLENKTAVQEILNHLEKLVETENLHKNEKMQNIFQEAVSQYGTVLKKLAE